MALLCFVGWGRRASEKGRGGAGCATEARLHLVKLGQRREPGGEQHRLRRGTLQEACAV